MRILLKNNFQSFKCLIQSKNLLSNAKNYSSIVSNNLKVESIDKLNNDEYDSVVIIGDDLNSKQLSGFAHLDELKQIKQNHKEFDKDVTFIVSNKKRIIYSPVGPLDRDYDDVRRVAEATNKAFKKAIKTGAKKPLLVNLVKNKFDLSGQVSLLAALEAAHIPLEVREAKKNDNLLKVDKIGYWHENTEEGQNLVRIVQAIELGRVVTRDIGGSDPERMSALNVLNYVTDVFKNTEIKMSVIEKQDEFDKNYPCFSAVNRAARGIERHRGRIIKLEYDSSSQEPINTSLFLVGKGLTYDTGGADVKYGGNMASMHRDKCGAAFVAGFFKTLELLKPKGLKVYGTLCLTRNNIGEECYVADEIITARSKKRIRIGNTDAEGRMAICDSLCEAKDLALKEKNPFLFTIATLTGHVMRTYGQNYSAVMCNGPAKNAQVDEHLQHSGDLIGDPFEISTIRKEDYETHKGKSEYEDLQQAMSKPSADSSRGHQGPAAFLIMASGLEKHGGNSKQPLPYSHIDIAGSCGKFPGLPSAAPLPAFVHKFILPRL